MTKKEFKDDQGPSKLSKVTDNQEEWHTNTSDDEESYINEIDTLEDEEYFNEIDEFEELDDVDDVADVSYVSEKEKLDND